MAGKTMTYLLHAKCGTNLYLDVTGIFRIITTFGIGKTVLRIRQGQIIQTGEVEKTVFYCPNCSETVTDLNAVIGQCMYCGKNFPIRDLVSPSQSNGIYCREHGTRTQFPGETIRDLSDLVRKMSIK